MGKQALKERMLALEEQELAAAREHYLAHVRDARIDRDDAYELDAHSRAEYEGELAAAFDHPLHTHAEKIARLHLIDFGPKTQVSEGAVVRLGDRWFVVSVSTAQFQHDEHTYMGISTQAPIYRAMEGLTAGERFEFRGRQVTVHEVF